MVENAQILLGAVFFPKCVDMYLLTKVPAGQVLPGHIGKFPKGTH